MNPLKLLGNITFLKIVLFSLILIFSISLFKNIQYPLLWNDESYTVMLTQRVAQFGYPKVHDGKNTLKTSIQKDVGVKKSIDSNTEADWLQYYFLLPFYYISLLTSDFYMKTAILRFPFAVIGVAGIFLLAVSLIKGFRDSKTKYIFLIFFLLIEILSVPLILHLREARYYSLLLFFTSCIFYIYFRYHIFRNISTSRYTSYLTIFSLLVLSTYKPAFLIFIAFYFCHMTILFVLTLKNRHSLGGEISSFLSSLLPIIPSIIISIPYLIYFEVFQLNNSMATLYHFGVDTYISHLISILWYFLKYEYLGLLILCKLFMLSLFIFIGKNRKNNIFPLFHLSSLLTLFFFEYVLLISFMPLYVFTRYYIALLPIHSIITLLDIFIIFYLVKKQSCITRIMIIALASLFLLSTLRNYPLLQGHFYELTHQYKGPLDITIPFIIKTFPHPDKLVIATNYEETSYMYYLGSKVIVGYVGNNLKEDEKLKPDIIIYRKGWNNFVDVFNAYLAKNKYVTISFPYEDYPVNNIPDFTFVYPHQFKTLVTEDEKKQLTIYVRADVLKNTEYGKYIPEKY